MSGGNTLGGYDPHRDDRAEDDYYPQPDPYGSRIRATNTFTDGTGRRPNPVPANRRPGMPGIPGQPNPPPAAPTPLVPGSNSSQMVPYQPFDNIRPSSIALQAVLYILDVNDLGIISDAQAREFQEHSSRWNNNYTPAEVISRKAQQCIGDLILIDIDYPYHPHTKASWMTRLTVVQIALLVLRYFRTDNPPGKSLAESFFASHFAFCYNKRGVDMRTMTTLRDLVESHVQ